MGEDVRITQKNDEYWPPIMCTRCWGMKFVSNEHMSQCVYCGHVLMHWRAVKLQGRE